MTDFKYDEIVSIEELAVSDSIDIHVSGDNLFYANDILTHNSGYDELSPTAANISGGISKANTSDLVCNVNLTTASREREEITFQLIKTRNSGGVGKSVVLGFDPNTLRIYDKNTNSDSDNSNKKHNEVTETTNNTYFKNESIPEPPVGHPARHIKESVGIVSETPNSSNITDKTISSSLSRLINKTKNVR